MALLALSHTPIEHRLYEAMLAETLGRQRGSDSFSVRRLLGLSGLRSFGSVRRGCLGLVRKLSIELEPDQQTRGCLYRVFSPQEVFRRRCEAGMPPYPQYLKDYEGRRPFNFLIRDLVSRPDLSRREALVVLGCVEGLSNAEIGKRLEISEQTVKSHLRQVFGKFGVRRRVELVSQLLTNRSRKKSQPRDASPVASVGRRFEN